MLRAVQTRSPLSAFEHGSFQTVLDDQVAKPSAVHRVVLASGKIAHEALGRRDALGAKDVAIVRVEQIYPWPAQEIERVLATTSMSTKCVGYRRAREHGRVALRPSTDARSLA